MDEYKNSNMNAKEFLEKDNSIWAKISDESITKSVIIEFAEEYAKHKLVEQADSISEENENDVFSKCALKVQHTWQMGGLAGCMYEEYARNCFREYFNELQRIYH